MMIFSALVALLIALSLAFLIVPVMRKPAHDNTVDREQQNIAIARERKTQLETQMEESQMTRAEFEMAMSDLETSLAIDLERQQTLRSNHESGKWAIIFFVVFVPALSLLMYFQLGNYAVVENPALVQARVQPDHDSGKAPSIEEILDTLQNHLNENPDDAQGWFLLARTYMSLQRYQEAVSNFRRSHALAGNEPAVMLGLADALSMTQNGLMAGESEQLVLQALELSPDEISGLWLAGIAAEQADRNREAFDYWVRLLPLLNKEPESVADVKAMLIALKEKQPDLPELDFETPVANQGLKIDISLDEKLLAQARPGSSLFVYAKAASGSPMPLAAKRLTVSDLPVQVTLSDGDALLPQLKLSGFDQVVVGAHISESGEPVGQPGDLFSESGVIDWKTHIGIVEIRIDQIRK